jgi:hypothetical protein
LKNFSRHFNTGKINKIQSNMANMSNNKQDRYGPVSRLL